MQMLFFELYKIMVNKVTFVGFRGDDCLPLGSALVKCKQWHLEATCMGTQHATCPVSIFGLCLV